jgi:hypothetical protein
MNGGMVKLRIAILISVSSIMMGAYINCTGRAQEVKFSNDLARTSSETQTESGQPYDGKVFVVASADCADGIEIKSRIIMTSSRLAKLDRENCEYIRPVTLTDSDFQISATDPSQLVYQNETFKETAPLSMGITNFLVSGDANNVTFSFDFVGQPKFLQVLLDTDNSFSTGYNYSGDIGADYLLENVTLYNYSGNGGAWGWTQIGPSNMIVVGQSAKWTIPRASIGSPGKIQAKARTSLGYSSSVVIQ